MKDTTYSPVPYLYKSRGLTARPWNDRAPEFSYTNMMNCQEREEEAMSSRYGTVIVNRDPSTSTSPSNYFFDTPVTSLARLTYLGNSWRYAGTADGQLWRRFSDNQGPYTSIFGGLSGDPFQYVISNCFETSQAYIFFYDKAISIKDTGQLSSPQLTGIDAPVYTANTQPFAPLLLMIDSFASDAVNPYEVTDVSPWGSGPVAVLSAGSGQLITDFSQFYNITPTGGNTFTPAGDSTTVTAGNGTSHTTVTQYSPNISWSSFAVIPSAGQSVTITAVIEGNTSGVNDFSGVVYFQYSPDGGTTWSQFAQFSPTFGPWTFPPETVTANISAGVVTNLANLRVRVEAQASIGNFGATAVTGSIDSVYATVNTSSTFGPITNGMVSLFSATQPSVNVSSSPINVTLSHDFADGLYNDLLAETIGPHGMMAGDLVAIYASSNDLVDGFYDILSTPNVSQAVLGYWKNPGYFYPSAVEIGAYGGFLTGGASSPPGCVLVDQYSTPYPSQMSAWGFYEWVPPTTTIFPINSWAGTVAASTTGVVSRTVILDLDQNSQVTDDDLIVVTLLTDPPANIAQIELRLFVGANGTSSPDYYTKFISPAYYQSAVSGTQLAYPATTQQIYADTLSLITGQPPNTISAQLQPSTFSTGSGSWQACYLRRGDFLPVGQAGQAGLDWANISGWELLVTTTATGSASFAVNGIYLQWGYGPSSFGGIGYDWRYTYYNADTGTESSPSPEQQFSKQYGYLASLVSPIFLRQAAQIEGRYSTDSQVTHVVMYRRGGILSEGWREVARIPNITGAGTFVFKDVVPDAALEQAALLEFDNDPPVTSNLVAPIQTTLAQATIATGLNSIYSQFSPQMVLVVQSDAVFVPNMIAEVGYASNLELVAVISGGTGTFTAILRLEHNQGEPVNIYAVPRTPCSLCALAYGQVWLAGDVNNPHYLYYSKEGFPENFGPENYIKVSSPSDPITAVINWRGTLYVATLTTWYIIQGGASPIAQPTGSQHGCIATGGWTQSEGAIIYRSADGLRRFTGSEGAYLSLPIEWIYRQNPSTPLPLASVSNAPDDVMCFYNNDVYTSYIAEDGDRYRIIWSEIYKRYRNDTLPMTAMLWEQDINTFLGSYVLGPGSVDPGKSVIVEDQVYTQDYDDGGWYVVHPMPLVKALAIESIDLVLQIPYQDMNKPHYPKQFNVIETDVNTQNQEMTTTLFFDDGAVTIDLANAITSQRQKVELAVNGGAGQQGYRMALEHTMSVSTAPIFFQENVYAAELAAFRYSFDTYWILGNTDLHKLVKQCVFDYTSNLPVNFSIFADNSTTPYYTFTLTAQPQRATIRVRFPAIKLRQFRMIGNIASGDTGFQMWRAPQLWWKPALESASYQQMDLVT